jgi:hypothetical protein
MTSFSMPSIALSNSASEADFQTSASRIFCEMNYITHRMSLAAKFQRVDPHAEEVVDEFDLVRDRKGTFGKVVQKPVTTT